MHLKRSNRHKKVSLPSRSAIDLLTNESDALRLEKRLTS